jgi:beta-lactamase class D
MLVAAPTAAGQAVEVPAWRRYFDAERVTGAFVIRERGEPTSRTSDLARLGSPSLPAPTIKVLSSLMALEAGVIANADEIVPWDGRDRCIAAWNLDLSLRSAYRQSAIWVYQTLVRRIDADRIDRWLRQAQYGNQDIGGGIERFWLDGDLRTSPWRIRSHSWSGCTRESCPSLPR